MNIITVQAQICCVCGAIVTEKNLGRSDSRLVSGRWTPPLYYCEKHRLIGLEVVKGEKGRRYELPKGEAKEFERELKKLIPKVFKEIRITERGIYKKEGLC